MSLTEGRAFVCHSLSTLHGCGPPHLAILSRVAVSLCCRLSGHRSRPFSGQREVRWLGHLCDKPPCCHQGVTGPSQQHPVRPPAPHPLQLRVRQCPRALPCAVVVPAVSASTVLGTAERPFTLSLSVAAPSVGSCLVRSLAHV